MDTPVKMIKSLTFPAPTASFEDPVSSAAALMTTLMIKAIHYKKKSSCNHELSGDQLEFKIFLIKHFE